MVDVAFHVFNMYQLYVEYAYIYFIPHVIFPYISIYFPTLRQFF